MKQKLIAFGLLMSALCVAIATPASISSKEETKGYKTITGTELKSWIDSGKNIQIVDARPKKYENGDLIVGAKFLAYDSDEKAIATALPSKDAVIVAYCASLQCPASTYLSEQLVRMGYTHVYKYPAGLAEWMEKGYPTTPAN